ncbi:MAG: hypothetical protein H0S82_08485, partial [Anaerolineaceae bacterium]|nr:hypothetical protein [Anaerolineaceae bacterium]
GLSGDEIYLISGLADLEPQAVFTVRAKKPEGEAVEFSVIARVDTPAEVHRLRTGGIMQEALNEA